jgi:hypothetical protein
MVNMPLLLRRAWTACGLYAVILTILVLNMLDDAHCAV